MWKLIKLINIEHLSLPSFHLLVLSSLTLFVHFIGLEINKSTLIPSHCGGLEILEIASYTTLACTGLISNIEEISNTENSSWKNLSVLKTAIKVYETPVNDWENIKKDLKNKSGIYCWINKTNNKIYIGSASLLPKRLSYYFQPAYINRIDMLITKSLLKYGLINFALAILEETSNNKKEILDREDFLLSQL